MSAPTCYSLTKSIGVACTPITTGTGTRIWLFNKSVWDDATITVDSTYDNLIDSIALASGETGIYLDVPKGTAIEPSVTVQVNTYSNTYLHQVITRVFSNTADIKEQVEKLVGSQLVVVVENNYGGTDNTTKFEVYGSDSGLYVSEGSRTVNDAESQGAYVLTFASNESASEGRLPKSIYITSIVNTRSVLNNLVAAA